MSELADQVTARARAGTERRGLAQGQRPQPSLPGKEKRSPTFAPRTHIEATGMSAFTSATTGPMSAMTSTCSQEIRLGADGPTPSTTIYGFTARPTGRGSALVSYGQMTSLHKNNRQNMNPHDVADRWGFPRGEISPATLLALAKASAGQVQQLRPRGIHPPVSYHTPDRKTPSGAELDLYGLGTVRTLADWVEYSGIDYAAQTVRSPWP